MSKKYIDETSQNLTKRIREPRRDMETNNTVSALVDHGLILDYNFSF